MGPSITNFVETTIVVGGTVADKFSFGTLVGEFTHDINTQRLSGPYFDIDEVVAAGFTVAAAPKAHAWVTTVFSQPTGVDQLLIGRKVPAAGSIAKQVWQTTAIGPVFVDETTEFNDATLADWDVIPAGAIAGDYAAIGSDSTFLQITLDSTGGTAGIGGTVDWEYSTGPGTWAALPGLTDGTAGFTLPVAAGQVVSWTAPVGWAKVTLNSVNAYYVRAVVTGVYGTDPVYDTGLVGGDATYTETMDALAAAGTFYIVNIESRLKADINLVAAWAEPRLLHFQAQSADLDVRAGIPGNTAEGLQTLAYNRTAYWNYFDDAQDLAGGISSFGGGFDLDSPDGVGTWNMQELGGIAFDPLTSTEAEVIYGYNANLFGKNKGLNFTSKGTMASGRKIHITTTNDWVKERTDEAILQRFVGTKTKVPFTNAGINILKTDALDVLLKGVSYGHFSDDVSPPEVIAPDVRDISAADKQAGLLTMTAFAVYAGSIEKLKFTINIQF